MRVTLKSLTKENAELKENNLFLSERNNVLESQFIDFEKLRIDCKTAKDELTESLKKEEILKKQLEREQGVIKAWKSSRDVHAQITKVQGVESFCDAAWKKSKEKLESNLVERLLIDVDSTDDESHPSDNQKDYPSSDTNPHLSAISKPVSKAKLAKLNEKYGSVSKNLVLGESNQVRKEKKVNVGHMSIKQLNDRLEKIEIKTEAKRKNNRIGKVGINKHNNYTPDKYAPRKIYVKGGSVNHLSVNCKLAMPTPIYVHSSFSIMTTMPSMPMNAMSAQNMNAQFSNMPFAPNSYYATFSMPQMPFSMLYWNNMLTNNMPFPVNQSVHDNSILMTGFKDPTQMTKDESDIPKSNEIKPKKPKKKANKAGPKETWAHDWSSTLLTEFKERAGPSITFGDDSKGYTVGYGLISKDNVIIEEVALVDGLKHNLLSSSQLCDKGNSVTFNSEACVVTNKRSNKVVLTGVRRGIVYLADFNSSNAESVTCLLSKASQDESWLWHKKLSHLNFKTMNELVKKELVRDDNRLLNSSAEASGASPLGAFEFGKALEIGLMLQSLISKLQGKSEVVKDELVNLAEQMVNSSESIKALALEFCHESEDRSFCEENGIMHEFSVARTPQQNGVVERKNRSLIEAARTMLEELKLPTYFWAEAVNTTCYTLNISLINQAKYEGIFVGYVVGKAYRVYNLRTNIVMESIHVVFDEKKIEGLQDEDSHESLKFDNVEMVNDDSDDESDQETMAKDNAEKSTTNEAQNSTSVELKNASSVGRQSALFVKRQSASSIGT
ncbi:hypothetical protein AgCh_021184 [Apium graveolens]